MLPVVSNTSPINYLVLIDLIEVLPRLFGEVFIPQAVLNELLHPAAPPLVREFMNAPPQWLRITQALMTSMEGLEHLDTGEAEAILLTAAIGARLIVMDDRAGVAAAGKRGLRAIGTIGVLDAAARHGIIDLATALDKLGKTTFRMPKRIRQLLITGAS